MIKIFSQVTHKFWLPMLFKNEAAKGCLVTVQNHEKYIEEQLVHQTTSDKDVSFLLICSDFCLNDHSSILVEKNRNCIIYTMLVFSIVHIGSQFCLLYWVQNICPN